MAALDIVGLQLSNLTAYNEYLSNVIIAIIVYMSAFSLVIRMLLSKKKAKNGANANAETTEDKKEKEESK